MHPTSTTFIYCPRSDDRVFAEGQRPSIGVLKHANGCRHVVGGVELIYGAADPGHWWRDRAKALATAIVRSSGGIAWDNCGTICLRVPLSAGVEADGLMRTARPPLHYPDPEEYSDADLRRRHEDRANRTRLLITGSGYLGTNGVRAQEITPRPTHEADPVIRAQHPFEYRLSNRDENGNDIPGQYETAFDVLEGDELLETVAVRYPWLPAELEELETE